MPIPPWIIKLGTPLLKIWEFFMNLLTNKSEKNKQTITYPKRTLILMVRHPHLCHWGMGSQGATPVMVINGRLNATNITRNYDIEPAIAILRKTNTQGVAMPLLNSTVVRNIPIGTTRELSVQFFVSKLFCKEGKSFKSDIIIIDQFNNKHIVKNIVFTYH